MLLLGVTSELQYRSRGPEVKEVPHSHPVPQTAALQPIERLFSLCTHICVGQTGLQHAAVQPVVSLLLFSHERRVSQLRSLSSGSAVASCQQ